MISRADGIMLVCGLETTGKRKQEMGAVQPIPGCAWRGKLLAGTYRRPNNFDVAYRIAQKGLRCMVNDGPGTRAGKSGRATISASQPGAADQQTPLVALLPETRINRNARVGVASI